MDVLPRYQKPFQKPMGTLWSVLLIILLLLLFLTLYTLVHEGGHALVGLLFGGEINAFSVNFFNLSAHVGIDGTFTPLQQALISVAGVSLPVLLCMGFLLLSPRKNDPVLSWFKLILFMGTINSLLAWIAIPILMMFGQAISDDSFNFINITHLPPLLVVSVVLVIYLSCWYLLLRGMGGPRALVNQFRTLAMNTKHSLDLNQPEAQKTLRSLAALTVVAASLTTVLTLALPDRGFQPPADYQKAVVIPLSQGHLQNSAIYRIHLDHPANVSFFFGLDQVKGGPIQIRLTGPNSYENIFFDIQDSKADVGKGSVHPQSIPLEKGDYEILATFQPSQGQLRVYIKIE